MRACRRRSQPIRRHCCPVKIGLTFPQSRVALAERHRRGVAAKRRAVLKVVIVAAQHQVGRLWSWKRPCCLTRKSDDSSSLMGSAASPATTDPVLPTFVVRALPNARDYGRC